MKTMIMAIAILLAGSATFAQANQDSTKKHHHHNETTKKYTCPMHPEVVKNKPGKCPKCNMTLVPMKKKTSKT